MKHIRLQLILLICSCLVLLPRAPVNVQAQDKAEDGKKVFDNYSTVVGMVYPAGGAMFKATGEMLDLFGYFGKDADPVGEAIRRINERLDILEKRVSGLETKVRAGQTLAQIANGTAGKSRDGLLSALVADATAKIDAAQKAGTITADQATQLKSNLSTRLAQLVDNTGPVPGRRGR